MSAVIKQAKPGETDVEKLAEVINLAYRGQGGWTTEIDIVMGERITAKELTRMLGDSQLQHDQPIFTASVDDVLVGCIQCQTVTTQSSRAVLGLFGVDPRRQAAGLGKQLVRYALDFMRQEWKCTECEIWVFEHRLELLAWYERNFAFKRVEGAEGKKPFVWPEMLKDKADPKMFQVLRCQL